MRGLCFKVWCGDSKKGGPPAPRGVRSRVESRKLKDGGRKGARNLRFGVRIELKFKRAKIAGGWIAGRISYRSERSGIDRVIAFGKGDLGVDGLGPHFFRFNRSLWRPQSGCMRRVYLPARDRYYGAPT